MRIIIFILVFIYSCADSHAAEYGHHADTLPRRIERYLTSAYSAGKFNGVALIAKDDNIVFHKAYGFRDASSKAYNDTTTRFPVLSITKAFTAIVVLKLNEEGKISLNDKVNNYLPELVHGNKITIEQLLNHTSGLHNYTDDFGEEDSAIVNHPIDKKLYLIL